MAASFESQNHVCPVCERVIVPATGQRGFARCYAGHRLRVLWSRPLWVTVASAVFVSYALLSILIYGINGYLQETYPGWIKACLLVAAAVWCGYLIVVGREYARRTEPMRSLGRQYLAVGIGRLAGTVLAGAVAWMDFPT